MSVEIDNAICRRSFSVADDPGRVIVAAVGLPTPDPAGDWRCAFHIDGVADGGPFEAHGMDALQAVLLAIEGTRKVLDDSKLTLSWVGGESDDTGIHHMVPLFLPATIRRAIERTIEQQAHAFARRARLRRSLRSAWHGLASRLRRRNRARPGKPL
jgi:hypothetical protein